MELHLYDGPLVSLVHPGAVPELGDPALGHAVARAGVHQPVDHQERDDSVGVAVHALTMALFRQGQTGRYRAFPDKLFFTIYTRLAGTVLPHYFTWQLGGTIGHL